MNYYCVSLLLRGPSVLADRAVLVKCFIINLIIIGFEEISSYWSGVFLAFQWSVQFFSAFYWSAFGKYVLVQSNCGGT